jgi:DNA-binding NtrC family response regulator
MINENTFDALVKTESDELVSGKDQDQSNFSILPLELSRLLHQNDVCAVEALVKEVSNPSDHALMHAIRLAWRGEDIKANEWLKKVTVGEGSWNIGWAHLALAELYLEGNKIALAKKQLAAINAAVAESGTGNENDADLVLSKLTLLMNARISIKNCAVSLAILSELKALMADCSDELICELIRGIAHILIGQLGRYPQIVDRYQRMAHLDKAVEIFTDILPDRYYLALANLELVSCYTGDDATQLADQAHLELKALGRKSEALLAWAKWISLNKNLPSTVGHLADTYPCINDYMFISPSMQDLLRDVITIADAGKGGVLLTGSTGAGKSKLAELIHALSPRKGEFKKLNCATLNDSLLQTKLFGNEKGAFTDAKEARKGLFEEANKGTLFLDEIGEMSLNAQISLLTVLDDGKFSRVGSTSDVKVDVRIIAATNRELPEMIMAKTFRNDLYYRIAVFAKRVPGLEERLEELPVLAEALLKKLDAKYSFTDDAKVHLLTKSHTGNIRDLENLVNRAHSNAKGVFEITAKMIEEAETKLMEMVKKTEKQVEPQTEKVDSAGQSTVQMLLVEAIEKIISMAPSVCLKELLNMFKAIFVSLVQAKFSGKKKSVAEFIGYTERGLYGLLGEKPPAKPQKRKMKSAVKKRRKGKGNIGGGEIADNLAG